MLVTLILVKEVNVASARSSDCLEVTAIQQMMTQLQNLQQ